MKIVNFIKSLLYFLLFLVFSFIIRFVGFDFIFNYNKIEEFDVVRNVVFYLFVLIVTTIACFIIFLLKTRVKKIIFYRFADVILNNKLKVFSWVTFLFISISSGLILFLFPVLYYYIFKSFFSKFDFIRKYYLDFKNVKKYLIIFLIVEFYFVLMTIYSFFDPDANGWSAIFIVTYYLLGNFYFYLPFFILSWWDNRKQENLNEDC